MKLFLVIFTNSAPYGENVNSDGYNTATGQFDTPAKDIVEINRRKCSSFQTINKFKDCMLVEKVVWNQTIKYYDTINHRFI